LRIKLLFWLYTIQNLIQKKPAIKRSKWCKEGPRINSRKRLTSLGVCLYQSVLYEFYYWLIKLAILIGQMLL
jgi:hypothetical protein